MQFQKILPLLFLFLSVSLSANNKIMCDELAIADLPNEISIIKNVVVQNRTDLPDFCQIIGVIEPSINFEARFPLSGWNGNYFQAGCGGFCGLVLPERETHSNSINHALRQGYAAITTDSGHAGDHIGDARWAKDNSLAEQVYAGDILPITHAAGHKLIKAIYGMKPSYSYFSGCSNGGRLGAKAAQDYPNLFDGIIAGCPVLRLSINGGVFGAWIVQANSDKNGNIILDEKFKSKIPLLESNAIKQCDLLDGKVDGIIKLPNKCKIDLSLIAECSANSKDDCLTSNEKMVVQKFYQGPQNSNGDQLFAGMPPGSERYWGYWYLGTNTIRKPGILLADGYLKYLGMQQDPINYSALNFNFDTDVEKLISQGLLFNAVNPDLTNFQKGGGKILMWHGSADPLVLPNQSIAYYEALEGKMGSSNLQEFFRLYMVPGMGHCWEIPSNLPDQMDLLMALSLWVEEGIPPQQIAVSTDQNIEGRPSNGLLNPYPQQATYQ
jgi:feruloyl esterase